MPDDPTLYSAVVVRAVAPQGTRVLFRRRREEGAAKEEQEDPQEQGGEGEAEWRSLLRQAVEDLNASFRASGRLYLCTLEEDSAGFFLRIGVPGDGGGTERLEEEFLDPADLPRWLARIRSRLGILLDETA